MGVDGFDGLLGEFGGGHFGLQVVGGDFGGRDHEAVFAWVGGFAAAVEEVGDVRVFFGFGHAELGFAGFRDDFAEEVVHGYGREQGCHEGGEGVAVGGHADGRAESRGFGAGEAVERGVEQGGEDFADAVGAEIEAEERVAVFGAVVVADDAGGSEFVGDGFGVARGYGCCGGGEGFAVGLGDEVVGFLYALPAFVAVHGVVAADEGGDFGTFGQGGFERCQIFLCALRGRVAAIEAGVDGDFEVLRGQDFGERYGLVLLGVDAAGGNQAEQVAGFA